MTVLIKTCHFVPWIFDSKMLRLKKIAQDQKMTSWTENDLVWNFVLVEVSGWRIEIWASFWETKDKAHFFGGVNKWHQKLVVSDENVKAFPDALISANSKIISNYRPQVPSSWLVLLPIAITIIYYKLLLP